MTNPLILLIVDGWGISAGRDNNAIRLAKIPNFKQLVAEYPSIVLKGSPHKDSFNYTVLGGGKKQANLGLVISQSGKKQLRVAETEKFAAITGFLNHDTASFPAEDHILVHSNLKIDYIKMNTEKVLGQLLNAIKKADYDFIVSAWPNLETACQNKKMSDAVGAIEYVDKLLGKLKAEVLLHRGVLAIVSTRGRVEEFYDIQTGLPINTPTDNPVPFILIGDNFIGKTFGVYETPNNDLSLAPIGGTLADIAPTLLKVMGIEKPKAMPGESLI